MPIATDIYYHFYEGGEEGQKPPLVLIHGAGGSHLSWPSEVRRLNGYRVYALDLPGHGKSGGCGQQNISGYALSVLAWMEHAGLHSAVFAGHSMGSAIALNLALHVPRQVVGLVLVGAGARLPVATQLLEGTASPTTFHSTVETITRYCFSPHTASSLVELAGQRMAEGRPSVLHGDFLACDTFDETESVAEIKHPTLVVVGAEDRMTPPRYAQYLASTLPNARLETLPYAGHMVQIEQPQAVASAMSSFLATVTF